jgi:hypothetical protein
MASMVDEQRRVCVFVCLCVYRVAKPRTLNSVPLHRDERVGGVGGCIVLSALYSLMTSRPYRENGGNRNMYTEMALLVHDFD